MKDPSLPVQAAIFAALTTALGAGVGVYDHVPRDPAGKVTAAFPYVHIGEDQAVSDADQCHDPSTLFATIHVWSRAVGKVEAKTLMAACLLALDVKLTVAGFEVIGHLVEDVRHLDGGDGVSSHSVATLRYRLGPTA